MSRLKRSSRSLRSTCPIAGSIDLLGDRWTLLVVRDLFQGKQRYSEFSESTEGIPTNVLAERLVRLEKIGIISSKPYQENPPRYAYSLTARGRELKPVLVALAQWGQRHVAGTKIPSAMGAVLGG